MILVCSFFCGYAQDTVQCPKVGCESVSFSALQRFSFPLRLVFVLFFFRKRFGRAPTAMGVRPDAKTLKTTEL